MTKDELLKRLIRIEGQPIRNAVQPRDSLRRDLNKIDISSEQDFSEFDPFDFEKEVEEIKPARDQFEAIPEITQPVQTFLVLEEDASNIKSGTAESFFVLDEDQELVEPTINSNILEGIDNVQALKEDSIDNKSLVNISDTQEVSLVSNEKLDQEVTVNTFKFCKYVRESGEVCKRQAPKTNDYCSSHRKVLAKEAK